MTELEFAGGYTHDPQFTPAEENPPEEEEPEEDTPEEGPVRDRALIVGDSQAQGSLGLEFERQLKAMGYAVTRSSMQGETGPQVYNRLVSNYESSGNPALVVAIFGSNGSLSQTMQAAQDMIAFCKVKGATLIAVGPGPAVEITDIPLARTVFGDGITTTDHWTTGPGASRNDDRSAASDYIDELGFSDGVFGYGIMSNMDAGDALDDVYTRQPDGVHIVNGADKIAAEVLTVVSGKADIKPVTQGTVSDDTQYNSSATGLDLTDPENYKNMTLDDAEAPRKNTLKSVIARYRSNPPSYDGEFDKAGAKYGFDPNFLRALAAVESEFVPAGKSPVGARGLMQLMPGTATSFGLKVDESSNDPKADERLDPVKSIDAAGKALVWMKNAGMGTDNYPELAGCYNKGPGIGKEGKNNPDLEPRMNIYVRIPETRNHMQLVMGAYHEFGGTGYLIE